MAKASKAGDRGLQAAITATDKLFASADAKWFNYLTEDCVVFSINHATPFVGKAAYQKHFEPFLTRSKRKLKVLQRTFQEMGDQAAVAQTLQVNEGGIVANIRQSLVWRKQDQGWAIQHLHSALIGQPSATPPTVATADAVHVLNERIATVAAVLGVAQ